MAHQQNQGVSRDRLAPLFRPGAHRLILQHPGVGGQFQSTYLPTGRGLLQWSWPNYPLDIRFEFFQDPIFPVMFRHERPPIFPDEAAQAILP